MPTTTSSSSLLTSPATRSTPFPAWSAPIHILLLLHTCFPPPGLLAYPGTANPPHPSRHRSKVTSSRKPPCSPLGKCSSLIRASRTLKPCGRMALCVLPAVPSRASSGWPWNFTNEVLLGGAFLLCRTLSTPAPCPVTATINVPSHMQGVLRPRGSAHPWGEAQ